MKNLVIYYPSYEKGGATKILINLINHFLKKNIRIFLVINEFDLKHKNLEIVKIGNKYKIFKLRFFSSLIGFFKLIKLISNLDRNETKILSMQSNFFSTIASYLFRFKIIVRVSEDPCGATKFADEFILSYIVLFSKLITYNIATFVIVNAEKSFNCVKKLVLNKNKVKILYNPSLKKINKFKVRKKNRYFLTVGRLCKQKNQKLIIEAFAEFYKDHKKYKLIICGDGPDKQKLIKLVKLKKLNTQIIFKKWDPNLKKYYEKSSVFILASLYEGMPNVLIEAINFNIPSIASDVSGVKDLLISGKGGIIYNRQNKNELKKKMIYVINNYSLFVKKIKYAKSQLKKYEINIAAEKYLKLLRDV